MEEQKKSIKKTIIEKWTDLQKIIKEEITIEDIINKFQESQFNQLKEYIKQYFSNKLESLKYYQEIINKENKNETPVRNLFIERDLQHVFLDIFEPIKKLLFLFRNYCEYIPILTSLIRENDEEEKINSLVELFCNQYFENILIMNYDNEEILILIYRLLEREICTMNIASVDDFINDSSFIGKFMFKFLEKIKFRDFLLSFVSPFLEDLNLNCGEKYLGLSLLAIRELFENKKKPSISKKSENTSDICEFLFKDIPKTSINLEQAEDDEDEDDIRRIRTERKIKFNKTNNEYIHLMDLNYLETKMNQEKNETLKLFYSYLIDQIISDPDIYSAKTLIDILKSIEFNENLIPITGDYKANFLFLQTKIDYLIQSLINKVDMIPYSIRCTCKMISLLIKERFPNLFIYLRNGFIGKLIFNKFLFPTLSLLNKNFQFEGNLTKNTKKCLKEIMNAIDHANKCIFYNIYTDAEKTIFNHYFFEIIPILNQFYEKLIDVELPPYINELLNKTKMTIKQNACNKIYNFRRKKVQKNDSNASNDSNETEEIYKYFNEHNNELLNLKCICFSIDDLLFILTLIGRDVKAFENLPKYNLFKKTYDYIQPSDYKLDQEISNSPDLKKYFIIYQDERNPKYKDLVKKKKKSPDFSFEKEDDNIEKRGIRFKHCIKTILTELRPLTIKVFPTLEKIKSNYYFFHSLNTILEDIGKFSEIENKVPLKWYGNYLFTYKNNIDEKYINNDYKILYDEIYNEELNKLNELKSILSNIITRDGINKNYANNNLKTTGLELSLRKMEKESQNNKSNKD